MNITQTIKPTAPSTATLAWKCRAHSTARWAYFATRRCRLCLPVTDAAEVPRGLLS